MRIEYLTPCQYKKIIWLAPIRYNLTALVQLQSSRNFSMFAEFWTEAHHIRVNLWSIVYFLCKLLVSSRNFHNQTCRWESKYIFHAVEFLRACHKHSMFHSIDLQQSYHSAIAIQLNTTYVRGDTIFEKWNVRWRQHQQWNLLCTRTAEQPFALFDTCVALSSRKKLLRLFSAMSSSMLALLFYVPVTY